jgi:hypothetical protein
MLLDLCVIEDRYLGLWIEVDNNAAVAVALIVSPTKKCGVNQAARTQSAFGFASISSVGRSHSRLPQGFSQ